jgi:hypothetical protein
MKRVRFSGNHEATPIFLQFSGRQAEKAGGGWETGLYKGQRSLVAESRSAAKR